MSPKPLALDADDLRRRYEAGETTPQLAEAEGVGQTTIKRRLAAARCKMRPGGHAEKRPSDAALRRMYVIRRMSSEAIAEKIGAAGPSVRKWLRDLGISRTRSEAMRLRMRRMTKAERAALAASAHDAIRGTKRTAEDLAKRAQSKESSQAHASAAEVAFADLLRSRGMEVVTQKAEGPYNIDLAAFPVAVEVFGGGFHGAGRHLARHPTRTRYLLDRGWSVVVVWVDYRSEVTFARTADYVVALADGLSRAPSPVGQYRVIRGDGELRVVGCAKDDEFPVKAPRVSKLPVRCRHQG